MEKSGGGKTGVKRGKRRKQAVFFPPRKDERATLSAEVRDEPDPDWRRWFIEVAERREDERRRRAGEVVVSTIETEGGALTVRRKRSSPTLFGETVKKALPRQPGRKWTLDEIYEKISAAWTRVVGSEMARESGLHSFKAGVMTVEVFNSVLLQELRQFHQQALAADLRDIWPLETPLLALKFRIGKSGS